MATVKVANFAYVETGEFTLPGLRTVAGKAKLRSEQHLDFELPPDVRARGMVSFLLDTKRGNDNGIDLAFSVGILNGATWNLTFKSAVFCGVQYPIWDLRPGKNRITFDMSKGGSVSAPDPDEYLGGKGIVEIAAVLLTYHRDVTV